MHRVTTTRDNLAHGTIDYDNLYADCHDQCTLAAWMHDLQLAEQSPSHRFDNKSVGFDLRYREG